MKILGIEVDPPFIRVAILQHWKRDCEICSLQSYPLTEWNTVKQLYIENFKGQIITGLSAKALLLRALELKIKSPKLAQKAIAFQTDATSHFSSEEMLTVSTLRKKTEEMTEAILYSTPRDSLKTHLEEFHKLGVDPDKVTAIPEALCSFFHWKFPEVKEAILIHLGSREWTAVLIEEGRLKKAHAIEEGVEVLLEHFLQDRKRVLLPKEVPSVAKQTDLLSLHSKSLTKKLQELRQELGKTVHSFQRGKRPKPIFFTGLTDTFIHFEEFLLQDLKEICYLEPENALIPPDEKKFAVSIGLSFHENPIQFRREEFFPQKNWKRLGRSAILLLLVSLLASGALLFQGLQLIEEKREKLLNSLPTSLNKWISNIETHKKDYPYISKAPKVAEVFSWLATHPLLESFRMEGDPIVVTEMNYHLEKFPKIGALQEPYRAKVELEFKFKNGMHARKFHEALLQGDRLVNAQLEIGWETAQDSYQTSFYLKNRGSHDL